MSNEKEAKQTEEYSESGYVGFSDCFRGVEVVREYIEALEYKTFEMRETLHSHIDKLTERNNMDDFARRLLKRYVDSTMFRLRVEAYETHKHVIDIANELRRLNREFKFNEEALEAFLYEYKEPGEPYKYIAKANTCEAIERAIGKFGEKANFIMFHKGEIEKITPNLTSTSDIVSMRLLRLIGYLQALHDFIETINAC